jgi:hypothetical protein
MTWTVTALGTAGTLTPATTVTLTPSPAIAIGDGVAVFVQYSDFQIDAVTCTDNASPPNTYTPVDSLLNVGSGQALASFYCASAANAPTTITAKFGTAVVMQTMGAIKFKNSVSGTPTLDGHSGLYNSTATLTPNSAAATGSNNGDLVLAGIIGDGSSFSSPSLGITGVTTTSIRNNQNTAAGYLDGSGVTTTTGSVTSTWTVTATKTAVVLEVIFAPPAPTNDLMAQASM